MDVDAVVDEIREREEERAGQAERLREELAAADRAYLRPVEDAVPGEMAVGGVDGGLAQESLHGMDVVLTRAVAAVFDYADGELSAADYHPSKNPSPDVPHRQHRAAGGGQVRHPPAPGRRGRRSAVRRRGRGHASHGRVPRAAAR
ncbi:MAG: hypothetical protein SVU88_04005 [Candidatus Nanohaloarchaea archaeon]|nr:hypothetical protein [Candidatus Nanohaloarchaea archaeon]